MARLDAEIPVDGLWFGSDVGGTKVQSLVTDHTGRVLAELRAPTPPGGGGDLVAEIAGHVGQLRARLREGGETRRVVAAGIGLPASVDPATGRASRAPNVAGLEQMDLATAFGAGLGLPVCFDNDVNLAAVGEAWLGAGRGISDFAFIALGTGIGMGLMANGHLVRGARGAAGEIAWLPIGGDPFDQEVRRIGVLESRVSAASLLAEWHRRGGTSQGKTTLRGLFARAAKDQDPAFAALLDGLAQRVAQAVLAIAAVADPARVILGGGIGAQPELVVRTAHHLARCLDHPPELMASSLGNRAGALGAARLAMTNAARGVTI